MVLRSAKRHSLQYKVPYAYPQAGTPNAFAKNSVALQKVVRPLYLGEKPPRLGDSLSRSKQVIIHQVNAVRTRSLLEDFIQLEKDPTSLASHALILKGFAHHLFDEKSKDFYLERLSASIFFGPAPLTVRQQTTLNQKILSGLKGKLH